MDCRRLLPERHAEKLLIELRRAVKIGNPHGDVVQTYSAKAGGLRRSSERAGSGKCAECHRSERHSELTPSEFTALEGR